MLSSSIQLVLGFVVLEICHNGEYFHLLKVHIRVDWQFNCASLDSCWNHLSLSLLCSLFIYSQNGSSFSLELDLEHYVVPAPSTSTNSGLVYAANMTETPRSLTRYGVFSNSDGSVNPSHSLKDSGVSIDRPAPIKVHPVTYLVSSCLET